MNADHSTKLPGDHEDALEQMSHEVYGTGSMIRHYGDRTLTEFKTAWRGGARWMLERLGATIQSQDELCTFTLPDGGPCNLSGSHNVHTLLGGSLQHLFRPATSQAKSRVTDSDEWQAAVDNVARLICDTEEVSLRNEYDSLPESDKQDYRSAAYALMSGTK